MEAQVDLQASYALKLGGNRRLTLLADAFNLFNIRRASTTTRRRRSRSTCRIRISGP